MTIYEAMSLVLAIAALLWSYRNERRQDKLRKLTQEISERQLKSLKEEEEANTKAHVSISLIGSEFIVRNLGSARAKDVRIEFTSHPQMPPLEEEDLSIPSIAPSQSINLGGAIDLSCAPPFDVVLTWHNSDDSQGCDEFHLR